MPTQDAVRELKTTRDRLLAQLSELDHQRANLTAEIARIGEALAVLADGQAEDSTTNSQPVAEHEGKYRALWKALRDRNDDKWKATFTEIEEILGFSLPPSSRKHLPHWYGTGGSAVARAIRDAGWRASMVDLDAETVTLKRVL